MRANTAAKGHTSEQPLNKAHTGSLPTASGYSDSLAASGFDILSQIIWTKERLVLSRGHFH